LAAGLASGGLQRKDGMAKEELIELEGLVTEILPAFAFSSTAATRSLPTRPAA
jgi:hypothetical protein